MKRSYHDQYSTPVSVSEIVQEVLGSMLWVSMFVLSVTYLCQHAWR